MEPTAPVSCGSGRDHHPHEFRRGLEARRRRGERRYFRQLPFKEARRESLGRVTPMSGAHRAGANGHRRFSFDRQMKCKHHDCKRQSGSGGRGSSLDR